MSTILSPSGNHGMLGRSIATNLQIESKVLCGDSSEGEFALDSEEDEEMELEHVKKEANVLYTDALQLMEQLREKIQALKLSIDKQTTQWRCESVDIW